MYFDAFLCQWIEIYTKFYIINKFTSVAYEILFNKMNV